MQTKTFIPEWTTVAEHLRDSLGYSETTLKRTGYTYNVFVRDFCNAEGCEAADIVQQGIERVGIAFESGEISRDKLLRLRRLAFRMLQLIETGQISWKCAPLYGKIYGNSSDEALLSSYVEAERREHRHAESIIKRDENKIWRLAASGICGSISVVTMNSGLPGGDAPPVKRVRRLVQLSIMS